MPRASCQKPKGARKLQLKVAVFGARARDGAAYHVGGTTAGRVECMSGEQPSGSA